MKAKLLILFACILLIGCTAEEYDTFYAAHSSQIKSDFKEVVKEAIQESNQESETSDNYAIIKEPLQDTGYKRAYLVEVQPEICNLNVTEDTRLLGSPGGTQVRWNAVRTYKSMTEEKRQYYLKILTKEGKKIIITGGEYNLLTEKVKGGTDDAYLAERIRKGIRYAPSIQVIGENIYFVDFKEKCIEDWFTEIKTCNRIYHCFKLVIEED